MILWRPPGLLILEPKVLHPSRCRPASEIRLTGRLSPEANGRRWGNIRSNADATDTTGYAQADIDIWGKL
jgi:hypothetical protein